MLLGGIAAGAFLVALSGAMAPGALLVVTIGQSARLGSVAGPLVSTGHALLELFLVFALVLGLGAVLAQPAVMGITALAGGVVLAFLGVTTLRGARGASLPIRGETQQKNPGRLGPVGAGVLASAGNPYWLLWWATIGSGSVALAAQAGTAGLTAFYLGHVAADYAWYSLVSLAVGKGRGFLSTRFYRILLRGCGLMLLIFSVYFFRAGLATF